MAGSLCTPWLAGWLAHLKMPKADGGDGEPHWPFLWLFKTQCWSVKLDVPAQLQPTFRDGSAASATFNAISCYLKTGQGGVGGHLASLASPGSSHQTRTLL